MPEHQIRASHVVEYLGTTYLGVAEFGCTACAWRRTLKSTEIDDIGSWILAAEKVNREFKQAHATADSRELECMVAAGWLTQEDIDAAR